MNIKTIISVVFTLFFTVVVFSQQSINLSGKIKSDNNLLSDVLLELQVTKIKKVAVSNENGEYKFTLLDCKINDTLQISINFFGHKSFYKPVIIDQENIVFDIDLEKVGAETLKEVIIESKSKTENMANKSVYKINQKNFIKNTKAIAVLNSLPNVFYSENKGIIVEGNLKGKVFIDGVEAMPEEIKNIKVAEIDKVEVINNPTSVYGTDFLGAIINIITKKTTEQFFKSSIDLTGGARNNYWAIHPYFVYKKGIFNFKSDIQYLRNDQIVTDDLSRNDSNGSFNQNLFNSTRMVQNYINATLGLLFSEKSDLIISGYNGGYTAKGNIQGNFSLNNNFSTFTNFSTSLHKDLEIATVYKNKISENKIFYFKNKYAVLSDNYNSEYFNQTLNFFDVNSKIAELSFDLSYDVQGYKIFKKSTNIVYDLKYIHRNYDFSNTSFYLNQSIFNATLDVNTVWSEKFSTQIGVTLEHLLNKNDVFSKKYNLILPTINAIYHFKNKIDLKLGFSKKVVRPGADDLNESLIIYSPNSGSQGNSNLEQQVRNYYFLKFDKEFKNDNLSVKFFRATINNSIINVFKNQGSLLVKTLDNAAKFNSTGFDFDYTTRLLKKVDINFNSGLNYNVYESSDPSTVIKNNNGTSFNSTLYISSNLFKDKVSISLSGDYSGPNYTLLSKSITYPFLDVTINTNLFKDKIGLTLYVQNLLGDDATITRATSFADNFQQNHISRNNFTNIILTLKYNFGKKFDEVYNDNKIENIDIRKKQ